MDRRIVALTLALVLVVALSGGASAGSASSATGTATPPVDASDPIEDPPGWFSGDRDGGPGCAEGGSGVEHPG